MEKIDIESKLLAEQVDKWIQQQPRTFISSGLANALSLVDRLNNSLNEILIGRFNIEKLSETNYNLIYSTKSFDRVILKDRSILDLTQFLAELINGINRFNSLDDSGLLVFLNKMFAE